METRRQQDDENRMLLEDDIEIKAESFFNFRQPVSGCIYDIGKARGHILVPMNQEELLRFYVELERYAYDILRQI